MFNIWFSDISHQMILKNLKLILILSILALPPWIQLRRHINLRKKEFVLVPLFILYSIGTYYTQNIVPFMAVVAAIYMTYYQRYDEDELHYLRPLGKSKWKVLLSTICFKVAITIINLIYIQIFLSFGVKLKQQEVTKVLYNESWVQMLILIPVVVIVAPVLEEYVFRHFLYRNLSKRAGKIISAILTSLLFMLLHFNVAGAISFFGVGLYNCYLYEKYGYRASVLNHFMFNFVSILGVILLKIYGAGISLSLICF